MRGGGRRPHIAEGPHQRGGPSGAGTGGAQLPPSGDSSSAICSELKRLHWFRWKISIEKWRCLGKKKRGKKKKHKAKQTKILQTSGKRCYYTEEFGNKGEKYIVHKQLWRKFFKHMLCMYSTSTPYFSLCFRLFFHYLYKHCSYFFLRRRRPNCYRYALEQNAAS